MATEWIETSIKLFRTISRKDKKISIVIIRIRQYWNIKQHPAVRCGLHLKAKAYRVSLEMYRIWKLHAMSLVM